MGRAARAAPARLDGERLTACGSGVVRSAYSASVCLSWNLRNAGERRRYFTTGEWSRAAQRPLGMDASRPALAACKTLGMPGKAGRALYRPYKSSGLAALHV